MSLQLLLVTLPLLVLVLPAEALNSTRVMTFNVLCSKCTLSPTNGYGRYA